jgi:hypothetical protein
VPSLRLLQMHLNLHPLQQHAHASRPLRLLLFGCSPALSPRTFHHLMLLRACLQLV